MSITLETVFEKYLAAKKLSTGTRKEYRLTVVPSPIPHAIHS